MTIKLRSKVNFPATVNATGGLGISKSNGIWTVEPDWSYLSLETVIPDASGRQLWTFDPANDSYYRLSVQALIDNLPAGPPGDTGPTGPTAGIRQAYSSTTTDSDPGAGTFRLNNATPASATAAYLDNLDNAGATVSGIIDRYDDSTNTIKGVLRFEKSGDPSIWAEFNVSGSVVDGTGYRKLTLASGAGSGTFTDADVFAISFTRAGDKGADGAGTGDFSSNTASSVDGEMLLFSGTGGKTGKRSTLTGGLLKSTSGVPAIATSGTDYLAPPAGTALLKANSGGALANAAAGTDYQSPIGTISGVAKGNGANALIAATAGTDFMKSDTTSALSKGMTHTSFSAGTKSSGTFTPLLSDGNVQHATNGGAHTLAPPASVGSLLCEYLNNGSAGAVTTSGFTKVTGDTLTTVNGSKFHLYIVKSQNYSHLHVVALQ